VEKKQKHSGRKGAGGIGKGGEKGGERRCKRSRVFFGGEAGMKSDVTQGGNGLEGSI